MVLAVADSSPAVHSVAALSVGLAKQVFSRRTEVLLKTLTNLPGRVGVLGGSFDPIHDGHIAAALASTQQHALDMVILLPTFHNPLKLHTPFHDAKTRLRFICRLACRIPQLYVSDVELYKSAPHLTIDTLQEIKAANKNSKIFFLLGADNAARMHEWRRMDDYLDTIEFIPVGRNGIELGSLPLRPDLLSQLKLNYVPLDVPISSTEIRNAAKLALTHCPASPFY